MSGILTRAMEQLLLIFSNYDIQCICTINS